MISTRSSRVSSSPLTGSLPWSAMYFSISLFSKTLPDLTETTGCSGASPETANFWESVNLIVLTFRLNLLLGTYSRRTWLEKRQTRTGLSLQSLVTVAANSFPAAIDLVPAHSILLIELLRVHVQLCATAIIAGNINAIRSRRHQSRKNWYGQFCFLCLLDDLEADLVRSAVTPSINSLCTLKAFFLSLLCLLPV